MSSLVGKSLGPASSSGAITTATQTVAAGTPVTVWAISLLGTAADSDVQIISGGAGGTAVWRLKIDGTTEAASSQSISFPRGLACNGLRIAPSGASATAFVSFTKQ